MPEIRSQPGRGSIALPILFGLPRIREHLRTDADRLSFRQWLTERRAVSNGEVPIDALGPLMEGWLEARRSRTAAPQPRKAKPQQQPRQRIRRRLAGGYRSPDLPDLEVDQ